MSWTKGNILQSAFEEIGIANYVFDITPDEIASALRRLDSMMAVWAISGIRLGYNAASDADGSSQEQDSGLPDVAQEPVFLNLARRLAPQFGKSMSKETISLAKSGYDALLLKAGAHPIEMQPMGNLPLGAGYKSRYSAVFVQPPQELLTTNPDGLLEFNGPAPTGNPA